MDNRGIESLPVALLLGAILAACTIGLGIRSMESANAAEERRMAIQSFDSLVERARLVSYGWVGNARAIELNLHNYRILVDGELVQLERDGEILRSEILPLPLIVGSGGLDEKPMLEFMERLLRVIGIHITPASTSEMLLSGNYVIQLQRSGDELCLKIERGITVG